MEQGTSIRISCMYKMHLAKTRNGLERKKTTTLEMKRFRIRSREKELYMPGIKSRKPAAFEIPHDRNTKLSK